MMLAEAARPARQSLPFTEVDDRLRGRSCMDSGHEALLDAKLLVDDLDKGRKTVGCARGAGDDSHIGLVVLLVHTDDDGRGLRILGWCRNDDFLRTALEVLLAAFGGGEGAGGLADILN